MLNQHAMIWSKSLGTTVNLDWSFSVVTSGQNLPNTECRASELYPDETPPFDGHEFVLDNEYGMVYDMVHPVVSDDLKA
jgi:hypothetical protein